MSDDKSFTELAVAMGRVETSVQHLVDRFDRFEDQHNQRLSSIEDTLTDHGKKIVALEADKKPKSPIAAWIAIGVSVVLGVVSFVKSLF